MIRLPMVQYGPNIPQMIRGLHLESISIPSKPSMHFQNNNCLAIPHT